MKKQLKASNSQFQLDGFELASSGLPRADYAYSLIERRVVRNMLFITRMSWAIPVTLDETAGTGHIM